MATLRLFEQRDIPVTKEIVVLNWGDEIGNKWPFEARDMFSDAYYRPTYYVAEQNGMIVGFCGWNFSWKAYDIYDLSWINVAPKNQGQGIGKQMMAKMLSELSAIGAQAIYLATQTPKYYRRFGFKVIDMYDNRTRYVMSIVLR